MFDEEVNRVRAEADLAYKLQAAKQRQEIRREEVEIEVVETRRMIEVRSASQATVVSFLHGRHLSPPCSASQLTHTFSPPTTARSSNRR